MLLAFNAVSFTFPFNTSILTSTNMESYILHSKKAVSLRLVQEFQQVRAFLRSPETFQSMGDNWC